MNRVFLDTSAAYALLVASDANHGRAAGAFEGLKGRSALLATTSYVLVESYALLASRVGLPAALAFREDVLPLVDVIWIARDLHERALDEWLARERSGLSLVDVVSFLAMRDHGLEEAFAYDRHFAEEGFALTE